MLEERMLERIANARVFGKHPFGVFLRINEWMWSHVPSSVSGLRPFRSYGRLLHSLVRRQVNREMFLGTFFLRNRPELELMRRVSRLVRNGAPAKIAVLGCSNGAEVYSIAWALRSSDRSTPVALQAVDISAKAVEVAREGVYSFGVSQLVREPVLERMSAEELSEMFDRDGPRLSIKPWIKAGIAWHVGDAGDPRLVRQLGPQDIVVANRFLCHMVPEEAERILRNIGRLVAPGGYLFVSGVDLDVRTKVASDLHWNPVPELLEEIHEGDARLRADWPCKYWGLEPLDQRRSDWRIRYASVFRIDRAS